MNKSTLVPREELSDLDWLARNVHVWLESANYVCVNHTDGEYVFHEHNRNCAIWFTKSQWLARRAELQNRPSFAEHPDAKCFVQNPCGYWWKNTETSDVIPAGDYWRVSDSVSLNCVVTAWVEILGKGEVLGDWRDTLEKRPEQAEFEQFTSIEDNQGRDMTQQHDMKQDSGWFERGELPPVGVECNIRHSCWNSEKYEKVTVAAITNEYVIVKYATFEQHYMLKDISFRPIRTAPEWIWLQVGDQSHYHSEPFPSDTSEVSWCHDSVTGCEVPYVRADLAGKLPDHHDQHPDDASVDRFAKAMKAKMAAAREKGRGGWDDPEACSVEFLADLLAGHIGKGNPGNFEDIANLAMMLHQRGADPAVLAHAATLTTCTERDKLVELIKTYRHTFRSDTEFADAILATGFSLEAK